HRDAPIFGARKSPLGDPRSPKRSCSVSRPVTFPVGRPAGGTSRGPLGSRGGRRLMTIDRRGVLAAAGAAAALPAAIARAAAIAADVRSGTIADVGHVVILMQENRGFDHYFGTMRGVRGFADRFPIPLPGGRTVWTQGGGPGAPAQIAPFPLNTAQ